MIAHSARRRRLKQEWTAAETFSESRRLQCAKFLPKLETDSSVTRSTSGAIRIGRGGSEQTAGLCRGRR
jgi:hypothetical protein